MRALRACVIAAHPDDETLGASSVLGATSTAIVVHVTNGAPRDARWWPAGVRDRDAYIRIRAREAERALAMVGARRIALGFDDQSVGARLADVVRAIADVIARTRPDVIITHAYEGGHPDHDAVAAAVMRARACVGTAALALEMALYHAAGGELRVGEWVDGDGGELRYRLHADELVRRRAMLEAYESQQSVLAAFATVREERFRVARAYDFSRRPHAGALHYERLGMAMWQALDIDA